MTGLPKGVQVKPYNGYGENLFCKVTVDLPGVSMNSEGTTDDIQLWVLRADQDKAIGEAVGLLLAIAKQATEAADALRKYQSSNDPR